MLADGEQVPVVEKKSEKDEKVLRREEKMREIQ
jgi:hypothetical protein